MTWDDWREGSDARNLHCLDGSCLIQLFNGDCALLKLTIDSLMRTSAERERLRRAR